MYAGAATQTRHLRRGSDELLAECHGAWVDRCRMCECWPSPCPCTLCCSRLGSPRATSHGTRPAPSAPSPQHSTLQAPTAGHIHTGPNYPRLGRAALSPSSTPPALVERRCWLAEGYNDERMVLPCNCNCDEARSCNAKRWWCVCTCSVDGASPPIAGAGGPGILSSACSCANCCCCRCC
ncbi:hypothetical protein B0H19DRAFT_539927 [Mycena capillaripes]|nr:hypothetical protein B0H19DRAFT_539927 [Mycena capillaripes]